MVEVSEIEKKAKDAYTIYSGCIPIIPSKDLSESAGIGKELQDRLHKLFISQDFVTAVHKNPESSEIQKQMIGEGIAPDSTLRKGIEIHFLDEPIKIELRYSSEKLDPDYYTLHNQKIDIEANLLYDGFTYIIVIKQDKKRFNYRRHAHHLDRWISSILKSSKDWNILEVIPTPHTGVIRGFFLKEAMESMDKDEVGTSYPHYCKDSSTRVPCFVYIREEDESLSTALDNALVFISVEYETRLYEYYFSQILLHKIREENKEAKEIIGRVTNQTLLFYGINFFNIYKRFKKSREIGKDLAHLYALMPQIEWLENEHESHAKSLMQESSWWDALDEALLKMLVDNMPKSTENIFSQNVREMLQQDVSEIRAQINYQILFVSAIVTFLAVIITAIVALIS